MIIYGSKATELVAENITDQCLSCGTQNSVQMVVFQKYAHVFWIPFFPIGKTGATQCSHCKQVLQKKEFSENFLGKYRSLVANSKTPIWTFVGLAIFIALIIWGVASNKNNAAKNAQLILTPQKGDVYEVKNDYRQYTLYKVDHVNRDTVFLLINQYETNKVTGLSDLKDKAYSEDILPILKQDLKNMLDKGEIIDIDRK